MKNQKSALWFRVFALCLAVGLGGVFVGSRQKSPARQVEKVAERESMPGSENTSNLATPSPLAIEFQKPDRSVMPGSKSARVLMPGSKSFIVVPAQEQTSDRTVMPGSKSLVMPLFEKRRVDAAPVTETSTEEP